MTYRGIVKNGVVVPDRPDALPEGAEVGIRPLKGTCAHGRVGRPQTIYERYRRCIGIAKGMPPDASRNVDHYLYGAPKRK